MSLTLAFITITGLLAFVSWLKSEVERAVAFVVVMVGLCIMAFAWGQSNGVIAFAVWTLVSYLLLNFPVAATLYLCSAFCYTLKLQGDWAWALQLSSNLAGLAGLVAIWYGTPKWRYVGLDRARHWGGLVVDFDTTKSSKRHSQPDEEKAPQ